MGNIVVRLERILKGERGKEKNSKCGGEKLERMVKV